MDRSAFRDGNDLLCKKCFAERHPHKVPSMDEERVVKREALPGRVCADCNKPFLEDGIETRPSNGEAAFRKQWQKGVEAGRALPSAGDLFEGGDR